MLYRLYIRVTKYGSLKIGCVHTCFRGHHKIYKWGVLTVFDHPYDAIFHHFAAIEVVFRVLDHLLEVFVVDFYFEFVCLVLSLP